MVACVDVADSERSYNGLTFRTSRILARMGDSVGICVHGVFSCSEGDSPDEDNIVDHLIVCNRFLIFLPVR